jgi:hypothetical protein
VPGLAGARIAAAGHTGDALENDAERTTQYVGGLAGRKEKRLPRSEFEAQRKKLEAHVSRHYTENVEQYDWIAAAVTLPEQPDPEGPGIRGYFRAITGRSGEV